MHHHNHTMAIITMATALAMLPNTICLDSVAPLFLDDLEMGIGRTGDLHPLPGAHELILLPNALEFPRTALHSPASHAITLFNNHHNKTVYLNSVVALPSEALYSAFHVSFVRDQAVPPQGNVTFTVIFLATRIGPVNTELLVRTNFGQLKYQVTGIGVASPFKVVPLTHLVSYSGLNSSSITIPDISLYNPYNEAIQITEIFSSGGKFYLELPTEDDADRSHLWTIAPYDKKAVIRVRFTGSVVAGNYSAYIRMKLVSSLLDLEEMVLVIPIHMEVREQQPITLYPERSLINLGSVLLSEKRHPLHINFYQSHTQEPDIGLESMDWETELSIGEATTRFRRQLDCNNIVVGEDFLIRLKIECDLDWMDVIRNVSQSWDAFIPGAVMQVIGGVTVNSTVRSKKTSTLHRIPFFAELIPGSGIELPPNMTVLFPTHDELTVGLFYLRNNFDNPIVVAGIRVEWKGDKGEPRVHPAEVALQGHFQSVQDDFPRVLKPGESYTMGAVTLPLDRRGNNASLASFDAQIHIHTNVTSGLALPLYGYSGKFRRLMLHDDFMELMKGAKEAPKESELVTERDFDVVDFGVVRFNIDRVRYMALWNDNPVPLTISAWSLPAMNIFLYSINFMGCFSKSETRYDTASDESTAQPDEWCIFEFSARTPTLGDFNGTFQYETDYEVTQLPIKIVGNRGVLFVAETSLHMRNCFPKSVCSVDISIHSSFSTVVRLLEIIPFEHERFVLFTDQIQPNTFTTVGRMYLNMQPNSVYTNNFPNNIFDSMDMKGLEALLRRSVIMFHMIEEENKLPIKIVTDVMTMVLPMTYEYVWPQLIDHSQVTEIVAVVGREQQYNITIANPLDEPIAYWYFLDHTRLFELPEAALRPPTHKLHQAHLAWKVAHLGKYSGKDKLILAPGETRNVTVFVKGEEPGSFATVFLLKNNFTYFEGTWLGITVSTPQFKFGNRKPSCTTPLLFEVQDQPNACVANSKFAYPLISTKRVFTAKNAGQLPITITGISINSENCSGHGFVVLNCAPFLLLPNQTHKIEISFVPDFTMSRIERKLIFSTDIEYPMAYVLVGVTPVNMLNRCAKVLDRPWWEEKFKKWVLSMMATMAIIVTTVAFFESMKILKDHSEATYRQRGPFQPPLDFKKLTATKAISTTTTDSDASATKESVKPPKKKASSNLFDNKRFSWFIKRSQAEAVSEVPPSSPSSSTSSSGDKKPAKNLTKTVDKTPPSKSILVTTAAAVTPVEKSPATESKKSFPASNSVSAKKENLSAKKSAKVKSKSLQQLAKPADTEQKVEIAESVESIIDPDAHNKKEVTLHLPKSTPLKEQVTNAIHKDSPTSSASGYGKTPGRERKEKQVQAKRNPPGRANKISLFNNPNPNNETPTDPWTNACRGLFQANGDSPIIATPGGLPYEEPQFRQHTQQPPFSQGMNFHNQEPINLLAMNGHSPMQSPPPAAAMPEELNGCSENPLGAIGTIPPISKSHANYLLAMELQEQRNSYYNSPMFYNDGFDQHVPYQNQAQNNFPVSTGVNDPFGNFNMDSMYSNQFGGTNDLQGLYAEYQKQQLERLALLQRLALHQQQQQNGHVNMGQNSNHQSMRDYTSWDLSQDQWRAQRNLEQALQPEQPSYNRSGMASGPPPGLNVRHSDQRSHHNNSEEDTSNQYDPLRSIWNQWNANNQ